jgi:2-hydroxychromene-2-carboxylate isomerase
MSVTWYFDVISPFAYLSLQRLAEVQCECAAPIVLKPIALGAVLAHCGQLGPAEIPKKRDFAYRFVHFQAEATGFPLRFPPSHPFNPLPALRLICAAPAAQQLDITHAVFQHIWREGRAGDTPESLNAIAQQFGIDDTYAQDTEVKATLKANTDAAIAAGVFGVPTLQIGVELFWGFDAIDYAIACLRTPAILNSPEAQRLLSLPASVARKR